jgi:lipoprotein-releasing system ATP-binding protein
MNNRVLHAENITKEFLLPSPFLLLKGVDFSLHVGEIAAILGKSGEGKTTLLHILGTIDTPTTGTVWFKGQKCSSLNTERLRNRHFGFVFQSFHLLLDATSMENLLLPAAIAREETSKKSRPYEQALYFLEKVGLARQKDLIASKLSGGEKQRLAIARAFMQNPEIIFADEPTGNLDHITAQEVRDLLFSWARQEKKSLLFVTHSQDLANSCDTRYTLDDGLLSRHSPYASIENRTG